MIKKVAFIAHPTRNVEAAKKFYGETLGLETSADYGDAWFEFTTPDGATIALDTITPKTADHRPCIWPWRPTTSKPTSQR